MAISYKEILESKKDMYYQYSVGTSKNRNIDKTAVFYHVVTSTRSKERIYYSDVAAYRHTLLCQLCKERNVRILYSLTMPNHTHDVFLTPDWETLSEIIRLMNTNVSKYIMKKYPEKRKHGKMVFSRDVAYIPIRDIVHLFYVGMYIYTNPSYFENERTVPHSCFWMFERNYFPEPYDGSLYEKLFNITVPQLFELFKTKTRKEFRTYAIDKFKTWTDADNNMLFFKESNGNS